MRNKRIGEKGTKKTVVIVSMSRPGEETGHGVPRQMVDPAFLPELSHDGIDPGKAGLACSPLGQSLGVPVPWDLHADGVAGHPVEVGVAVGRRVKELPPQKLSVQ